MIKCSYIKKYIALSAIERSMLREAWLLSAYARILLLFFSMEKLLQRMYATKGEQIQRLTNEQKTICFLVHRAVRRCIGRTPWRYKCFEQAITARLMLEKRKIPNTLYLGVQNNNMKLKAHAWLRCGDDIITGSKGKDNFIVVAAFS